MGAREEQTGLMVEQSFVLIQSCKGGRSSSLFGSPGQDEPDVTERNWLDFYFEEE